MTVVSHEYAIRLGRRQGLYSTLATTASIREATEAAVKANNTTGLFKTVVDVNGQSVTVEGAVVNGVVKIGTAYK